jgi:hypothetical protein
MVRMSVGSQVSSQAPDRTREGLRLEKASVSDRQEPSCGEGLKIPHKMGRTRPGLVSLPSVFSGTGTSPSLSGLCFLTMQQHSRQNASISRRKEKLAFQFLRLCTTRGHTLST